jgi:hypothetical protein
VAVATAVALPMALGADEPGGALVGTAAAVLLLAAAVVFARWWPVPLALVNFGLLYALSDTGLPAPLVGGALLLAAELASWSIDERIRIRTEPGVLAARARAIGWVVAAGTAASAVVLAVAEIGASRSTLFTLVGALAAVGCLRLLARQPVDAV